MAMPPGNIVLPEKMQFPAAGPAGNEIAQLHYAQHGWFPVDDRDWFISWLRGEFAAANAIIDSLLNHLGAVGDPGEYDFVIGYIQQRRCSWTSVLHMQHFYPVGDVVASLQQITAKRQQQWQQQQQQQQQQLRQQQHRYNGDQPKLNGKETRRFFGSGLNKGNRAADVVKEGLSTNGESIGNSSLNANHENFEAKSRADGDKLEDKDLLVAMDNKVLCDVVKPCSSGSSGNLVSLERSFIRKQEVEPNFGDAASSHEDETNFNKSQQEKKALTLISKDFSANELIDGKMVNVVDGLKLYEKVLDDPKVSELTSLVNDMRSVGKMGNFQGHMYTVSKKPMKGHGREVIQLGVPVVDVPADNENATIPPKERVLEPIPALLQDVIEQLLELQLTTTKPDSCVIDIYHEGDYLQPCLWSSSFGKPILVLSLTECELTFGRVIMADSPGDYKGSLTLTVSSGALIVMHGKSLDFVRHAISMAQKERVLITFSKAHPKKKFSSPDGQRVSTPPNSRSPRQARHHSSARHYPAVPTAAILQSSPSSGRQQPTNGNVVAPLFIPSPAAAQMPPFPSPISVPAAISNGWHSSPAGHSSPVGTGVFLPPPGSGNLPSPVPGREHDQASPPRNGLAGVAKRESGWQERVQGETSERKVLHGSLSEAAANQGAQAGTSR